LFTYSVGDHTCNSRFLKHCAEAGTGICLFASAAASQTGCQMVMESSESS